MDPYVGEIRMFSGDFSPRGWALCSGQLLPISQNEALFTIIGTTYGGDGVNTFAVPDLRGRTPVHYGSGTGLSPIVLGQKAGTEEVTMTQAQMPAHTHSVNAVSADGNNSSPVSNNFAGTGTSDNEYAPFVSGATTNVTMGTLSVANNGFGAPYPILQPSVCISFIIATQGIFPVQS